MRSPVDFEESAILPQKGRNQKWKCWLWGVQETWCHEIYTTGHGKASPFQRDDLLEVQYLHLT